MNRNNSLDQAILAGKRAFKKGVACIVPNEYKHCEVHFAAFQVGWGRAAKENS